METRSAGKAGDPSRVGEAIRALLPPLDAEDDAYLPAFHSIADLLLNRATLFAGGVPHRLVEIELYFHGGRHPDRFSHRSPIQRETGLWYFHRQGQSYRSGSYKGLDITCGHDDAFGGILIRAVERLAPPIELVEGPSRFVDHLLRLTGSSTVPDLVDRLDPRVDPAAGAMGAPSPLLHVTLEPEPGRGQVTYESPRIGLSLKRGDLEHQQRFLARPYRFVTEPARLQKGKPHLALALHRRGLAPDAIARTLATRTPIVEQYIRWYEHGKTKSPGAFRRDLSTRDLCELLGACHRFW